MEALDQYVEAEYSKGMYDQFPLPDGTSYNISLDHKRVAEYEERLTAALDLYRQRLEWLTTGSYRAFGRVVSDRVCLV